MSFLLALVAAPAAAAPLVGVRPVKQCYRSGEKPAFAGLGFTPSRGVNVLVDGVAIGSVPTNTAGVFAGTLTLGLASGEKVKTYSAVDQAVPALSGAVQLRVSALAVKVRPRNGTPGQKVRLRARGFTTGKRLWAHLRGHIDRDIRVGRLKGRCHKLRKRRRIIPAGAPNGTYSVQFDTRRRYRRDRKVMARFTVSVYPFARAGAAGATGERWTRTD